MINRRNFLKSAAAVPVAAMIPLSFTEPTNATVTPLPEESLPTTSIYDDLLPWQEPEKYSTGIAALDELLGGGMQSGTLTTFVGGMGCGKLNLAIKIAQKYKAIERHELNRKSSDPYIGFDYLLFSRNGIQKKDIEKLDEQAKDLANYSRQDLSYQIERMSFVDNLYTTAQRNNGVGICVVQSPRAFFPEMEGNGPKVFSIQSSNVIFFPSVLYKEDKPCDFKLELRVLKARMGRTGTVYTRWF